MKESEFRRSLENYYPDLWEDETYLHHSAYRLYRMAKFASSKNFSTIVDVGCYPGTLLKLLRRQFPLISLCGLGLGLDVMRSNLEDLRISLHEVNLDPDVYFDGYEIVPTEWPIPDASVDVIFATEVIEHLYNPYFFMRQTARVLKPSGFLYITTDNIVNPKAIFRILRGSSPNGLLAESQVVSKPKDNWRGHVRLYSRAELHEICKTMGLTVISSQQFWNKEWYQKNWITQSLRNYLLWLIPAPYRGHYEIIAQNI